MEEKGSLGIFLSRDKAVAVWVSSGHEASVLNHLPIPQDLDKPETMALQAARSASRQGFAFDEVFLAVDCGYYTQYNLQSEFEDYRQIESTIKFDAEEAAATDAMSLAVTFEIMGAAEIGSDVMVYTADRQALTDILLDVQEGGLDPIFIEPDVVCLTRALEHTSRLPDREDTLFVVISQSNCYMIKPNPGFASSVRTFLIAPDQDVTNVLIRQTLLTAASAASDNPLQSMMLIGQTESVDTEVLSQRTGLEVQIETPERSLSKTLTADSEMASNELLIAYGAALAGRTRGHKSDFRRDFMPYQGRRKLMEGSLRLISISLTILLAAVAVFYQLKTFRMKSYTRQITAKTLEDYKSIMDGKSPPPNTSEITILKRELRLAKSEQSGM
ncbi:MAG: hypothetical protein ACYTET_06430, partial [Planctomycetota bacterium]